MRRRIATSVVVALLAVQKAICQESAPPSPAPLLPPMPDCFTDLELLYQYVEQKNPSEVVKYVICPNTIHVVGIPTAGEQCCDRGTRPLNGRANTHYYCGEDGSSSNNCTLIGGQFQYVSVVSFDFKAKPNIVLSGITFMAGDNAGVIIASPGDTTFIDCVFRVS